MRAFALTALPLLAGCGGGTERAGRPNVVLVSIESLRADHVGCYGYGRATTPALDALAAEGTLFRNAHSVTSWTLASHATILTGLYPSAHKVIEPRHRLADSYETLAEAFAAAGYQCAAFVSGPFLRKPYNLDQGFEIYDDSPSSTSQEDAHRDVTNPEMEESVTRFLRQGRDATRPLFLFLYFWDVHYDYLPPPPYDTLFVPPGATPFDVTGFEGNDAIHPGMDPSALAYLLSQYDGEIRCTDDLLGRLFEVLRALGLWEETLIAVTADHGEEFFEHGSKGHKNNLYVESVHVPLVIKWAGECSADVDDRLAGHIDLFATLTGAAGLPSSETHGLNLARRPEGDRPPFFQELVTTFYGRDATRRMRKESEQWWAVRKGPYKLLSIPSRPANVLYDVTVDPGERTPIEAENPELAARYLRLLAPWRRRMEEYAARHTAGEGAALSKEELDRLRSLGYIERSTDGTAPEAPVRPAQGGRR